MSRRIGTRYRWMVANRVLAAVLGGYALTSLSTAVLALLMLLADYPANDARFIATMGSFAVYAGVALRVFAARSATRAWVELAIGMVVLGLALFWLKGGV